MVSVLDERRYLDSILLGERVHAKPGFRFIAATNTADLEGNAMPEFLRSRMRPVIRVGFPDRRQIAEIVTNLHPRVGRANDLLDVFWKEWDDRFGTKPDARQCSPRDAIYNFSLASSLADFDALGGPGRLAEASKNFPLYETGQALSVTVDHLRKAFQEMFPADSR